MTDFPNPLDVRIDFAFGADPSVTPSSGQWTEVPPEHWIAQSLSIPRGRQNEQDQVQSGSWSFQLLNDSGDYTPDRAVSPHYPHMRLGLPCRLRVGSVVRAIGNVAEISPEWPAGDIESDNDPGHSLVTVTVAGMLRRLQQGEQPLHSALRRWVPRQEHVVAYWPMEDEGGDFASGLRGGTAMSTRGEIDYASLDKHGSKPLPTINEGARFRGIIPAFTPIDGGWRIDWLHYWPADEPPSQVRHMIDLHTTSPNAPRWLVRMSTSEFSVRVVDSDDAQVHLASQALHADMIGNWVWCTLRVAIVGSSISYEAVVRNLDTPTLNLVELQHLGPSFIGGSGHTLGRPSVVDMPPFGQARALGHITVSKTHNLITADPFRFIAANGFPHEHAGERILRLCLEERVPVSIIGDHVDSMTMGPQSVGTFTEIIQEAADTDHGILSERRNGLGLEYRTRISMQNQALALELDAATFPGEITHPFAPTLDDQRTRNDWTMSRPGGSSGRFVNQQHVLEHGRYDDSGSVNVPTDAKLRHIAAWRVGHGIQPGMRYPSISPALNQAPDLINDWSAVRLGDRVQIAGLPSQHPAGVVDLIVQGYTETLEPHGWHVEANATPAAPWSNMLTLDHAVLGRVGFHAYLAEDIDDEATSFDIVVPVRRALNTEPGFEGDFSIGDTNAFDYTTFGGTLTRSTAHAFRGLASGRFVPDGTGFPLVQTGQRLAARSYLYRTNAWVFSEVGGFSVQLRTFYWNQAGATALAANGPTLAVPAGEWSRMTMTSTSPSTAVQMAGRVEYTSGTPSTSHVLFVDEFEVGHQGKALADETPVDMMIGGEQVTVGSIGSATSGVQTFSSVTRSQNGVVKGHAAGTTVELFPLPRLGLGN